MKKVKTINKANTSQRVRPHKMTKAQERELKTLSAMPDNRIDTSDIPETNDADGWKRGVFYRPLTRPITIRLNAPDIAIAQQLANLKGIPYQTYIKRVLHEALEREVNKSDKGIRQGRSTR